MRFPYLGTIYPTLGLCKRVINTIHSFIEGGEDIVHHCIILELDSTAYTAIS